MAIVHNDQLVLANRTVDLSDVTADLIFELVKTNNLNKSDFVAWVTWTIERARGEGNEGNEWQ